MARRSYYSLRVGEVVSKTFAAYFRNFVPFVVLSLLGLAPWIALRLWLAGQAPESDGQQIGLLLANLGALLLQLLLTYLLTGAFTFAVVKQLRGEPAPFGAIVAQGARSFGRVLFTTLICVLRVLVRLLLLIVPGIIEMIRLYAAIPVAVLEGKTGNAAALRSIELTDGSRGSIFGTWMVLYLINIGLSIVGGFVLFVLAQSKPEAILWYEFAMSLITVPLSAAAMAVCYALLRRGKENVDVRELAAVFA